MSSKETEEVKLLREILRWIRFTGTKEARSILWTTLDTDQKKIAYQASNGARGTREVARVAKYGSKSTVESLWKTWRSLGLGESAGVMGPGERFKRSFDLEELGLEPIEQTARRRDRKV